MRRLIISALLAGAVTCAAQTSKPASKPAAKPATAAASKPAANPTATFNTTAGTLTCELFADKAPKTVANFVGLANGTKDWKDPVTGKMKHGVPLYNGTIFHRVIPNFMIQGGDPAGNGSGGVGYTFADEFDPSLTFDRPGRLAMANSGPSTNGSQFFITEVPTPHLNGCLDAGGCDRPGLGHVQKGFGHTIFGQCDAASIELVKQIARMPRDERPSSNRPYNPVKITSITITGMEPAPKKPAVHKPSATTKKP
ncbi:MAG TPA: peptidylprolyl isomerase [Terriglobales bacterium]|nr:peptidylprolyl isomerase [Terriglobales bacterium]